MSSGSCNSSALAMGCMNIPSGATVNLDIWRTKIICAHRLSSDNNQNQVAALYRPRAFGNQSCPDGWKKCPRNQSKYC